MKKYLIVIECVIEYSGKFLLIRRPNDVHAGGLLAFPGGKVEELDESDNSNILENAVKREVFEEVGLALIDPIKYVTSCFFSIGNIPIINNVFYTKLEKTPPNIIASPREVPEYFFFTYDEVMNREDFPIWVKNYLKEALKL